MAQPFRIRTPLPATDLLLDSMSCSEALSTPTLINAMLLSPRSDIDANALLGQPVTFELELRNEAVRHFHGFVTRFSQVGTQGRFHQYHAVVRPWLWFLTRTTDSRIFQRKKVPDIVAEVFADHGIAVFDRQLFREYREWEYCVQYRESDFNFVSRLLEHEGISYRFEHRAGQHRLLLLDSSSANNPQPDGLDTLPFFASGTRVPPDTHHVSRFTSSRSVRPGKYVLSDYDFENPQQKPKVDGEIELGHAQAANEVFDHPGGFIKSTDATQYLQNRMEEQLTRFEVFEGATNAIGLRVGHTFSMTRHPRADFNAQYLVTTTTLHAQNGAPEAAGPGDASAHIEFSALHAIREFRPERRTPKPFVQGPHTAMVVGEKGKEIDTDRFGRVRVQFHWDRLGKKDEKSSCFVRVAQVWAGKRFGAIFTPRIGHEVIVDFLEGDPDQPIITGSVYNGDNMPPWTLPDNATQSGFQSRSTKDGAMGNANMIRFEDKMGDEKLELHAEKNMSTSVENDQSLSVGNDQSNSVKRDRKTSVGRDDVFSVARDHSTTVGRNHISVITGTSDQTVGQKLTQSFNNGQMVTVQHGFTQFVGDFSNVLVNGWRHEHVNGTASRNIGGASTNISQGDMKLRTHQKLVMHSDGDCKAHAANFKFVTAGNVDFRAAQFNRVIGEGNDTILGNNHNGYIGSAKDTKMGMAEATFIGLKRDSALALAMYFDGGLKMGIAAGLALEIKAVGGVTVALFGIEQKSLSLDQAGLKVISGGGGGGGGGGAGGAVGAGGAGGAGAASTAGAAGAASAAGFGGWAGFIGGMAGGGFGIVGAVGDIGSTVKAYAAEGAGVIGGPHVPNAQADPDFTDPAPALPSRPGGQPGGAGGGGSSGGAGGGTGGGGGGPQGGPAGGGAGGH